LRTTLLFANDLRSTLGKLGTRWYVFLFMVALCTCEQKRRSSARAYPYKSY